MNESVSSFTPAPTANNERITVLDSLRGIAVLGILLMNVPFFGLPDPAGESPLPMNEIGTINEEIFVVVNYFLNGTQRALFSMLFGAGMLLFISKIEKRTNGMAPADYFIRRQLWLVVFGLFNAYILLWPGDILLPYGICGVVIFAFRNSSVKTLVLAAMVSLLFMSIREYVNHYRKREIILKGEAAAAVDSTRRTSEQTVAIESMRKFRDKNSAEGQKEEMKGVLKQMKGGYSDAYGYFKDLVVEIEVGITYYGIWDILIFMFLGMAFFQTGILTGQASSRLYWILMIAGLSIGGSLSWLNAKEAIRYSFNQYEIIRNNPFVFYEIIRSLRSLGVFGLLMLLYRSGIFGWLFSLMRPVGQMAFTNYLTQSFLGGFYFLGAGLGKMGTYDRKEVYLFAMAVWIVQIIWSHLWLRYFRFGPLEWCWRSLTYWKRQPMWRS